MSTPAFRVNGVAFPDGSTLTTANVGGLSAAHVTALRALSVPSTSGTPASLSGYHASGDGGGGNLYWDSTSTDADDGWLTFKPTGAGSSGRWKRPLTQRIFDIAQAGAIGDGASHPLSNYFASLGAAQAVYPFATSLTNEVSWAATQTIVNWMLNGTSSLVVSLFGGGINIAGTHLYDQPLSFLAGNRCGVRLVGAGGLDGGSNDAASTMVYTGAGTRFIDQRSTTSMLIERLNIVYNNASFAGILVDWAHDHEHSIEVDSTLNVISRCSLGAVGITSGTGAKCLVSLDQAICCFIDRSFLRTAQSAIRCIEYLPAHNAYSNAHQITNCIFAFHKWSVVSAGQSVSVVGCTFEGTSGHLQRAYIDDIPKTVFAAACTFTFNASAQTITRSSGSWITDGWAVGMTPHVFDEFGTNTNDLGAIQAGLSATVMTVASGVLANESSATASLYSSYPADPVTSKASPDLSVVFLGKTITRTTGSWIADGFQVGHSVDISGTTGNNRTTGGATAVTATVLTFGSDPDFASETDTAGQIYLSAGCGPVSFRDCWFGDQFRPDPWFEFNVNLGGLHLSGNSFIGGLRVAQFNRVAGGLSVTGNDMVTLQPPLRFEALSGGIQIAGNETNDPIIDPRGAATFDNLNLVRLWMAGNTTEGSDVVDSGARLWKLRHGLLVNPTNLVDNGTGFTTYALRVSQGNSVGIGADLSHAYFQSFGSADLRLNDLGNNVYVCGHGGQLGVGKNTSASVLDVGGAIATTYGAQTSSYTATATDSFIDADATGGAVTITLPTAVTCPGREYTIKRINSGANAVTVATTSSQTIDGSTTFTLSAQNSTVVVVSNGANWRIKAKF